MCVYIFNVQYLCIYIYIPICIHMNVSYVIIYDIYVDMWSCGETDPIPLDAPGKLWMCHPHLYRCAIVKTCYSMGFYRDFMDF